MGPKSLSRALSPGAESDPNPVMTRGSSLPFSPDLGEWQSQVLRESQGHNTQREVTTWSSRTQGIIREQPLTSRVSWWAV